MPRNPVKLGARKTAQAGKKKVGSLRQEPRRSTAYEAKETDARRASRMGQAAKKGRHEPSRKVAIKGLEEEKKARVKREMRRRSRVSSRPAGPASGPGEG